MSHNKIIELCYFGSAVRGGGDSSSDIDVLCVVSSDERVDDEYIYEFLKGCVSTSKVMDVSIYGDARLREMWIKGHLFAWHIYLESKPVSGFGSFIKSLGEPSKYQGALVDIIKLKQLVLDVKSAIEDEIVSPLYEAGLLYVAARNVGISASWYSDNGLDFSRFSPYSIIYGGVDESLPLSRGAYIKLCMARHSSMRGGEAPEIKGFELVEYCDIILSWVSGIICKIEVIYEH